MIDFARIVLNSNNEQALFYVEPDGDDYILHQVINLDGIQADFKMTFSKGDYETNMQSAYKALELVDSEHVDNLTKTLYEMFEGEDKDEVDSSKDIK